MSDSRVVEVYPSPLIIEFILRTPPSLYFDFDISSFRSSGTRKESFTMSVPLQNTSANWNTGLAGFILHITCIQLLSCSPFHRCYALPPCAHTMLVTIYAEQERTKQHVTYNSAHIRVSVPSTGFHYILPSKLSSL